jgi:hypothetical protein
VGPGAKHGRSGCVTSESQPAPRSDLGWLQRLARSQPCFTTSAAAAFTRDDAVLQPSVLICSHHQRPRRGVAMLATTPSTPMQPLPLGWEAVFMPDRNRFLYVRSICLNISVSDLFADSSCPKRAELGAPDRPVPSGVLRCGQHRSSSPGRAIAACPASHAATGCASRSGHAASCTRRARSAPCACRACSDFLIGPGRSASLVGPARFAVHIAKARSQEGGSEC